MYRQHFSLERWPFESDIASDQLFPSHAATEAQARLAHLAEMRGIGLLTGEVGSGKTVACRRFVDSLPRGLFKIVYLPLAAATPLETMNCIAAELGLAPGQSRSLLRRAISGELSRLAANRQTPVMIIDETHLLSNPVLEDLRMLTNFDIDSERRFCLLLTGLTALRRKLAMGVNESLAQRLVVRHHMDGLAAEEVASYIEHRLRMAGAPDIPVFGKAAVTAIIQTAHGMPRRINQIAHNALAAAAADREREVTDNHVAQAIDELNLKA